MMDLDIVYSPRWFYGKDIMIDLISIFVLVLIAFFTLRYYRLNRKNRNYLLFASSFILMAVAFLFKIATNFTIYYEIPQTSQLGLLTLTYSVIKTSDLLFFAGYLMYRMLMLLGLYILYSIYHKQNRFNVFLIIYLILVSVYFSSSAYFMFHLTSLIILSIITYDYFKNYHKSMQVTGKWLAYSFVLIAASQLVFIFIKLHTLLYVIAELIQLAGYVLLLITFIKVLKDGKKKGKE